MCKCKHKPCSCSSGGGKDVANLKNEVQELRSELDSVLEAVRPFIKGHPVMVLENALDIACFSMDTGLGTDTWEGWAVCNGSIQTSPSTGKDFQTPNYIDRFIVGAGDAYNVGDTGGANSVAITTSQMPTHNHSIVDSGHSHDVSDPGHSHGASAGDHTHTFSSTPHTHSITVDGVGDHSHGTGFSITNASGSGINLLNDGVSGSSTGLAGAHTHSASANNALVGGTVGDASVAVSVQPAFVGITEVSYEFSNVEVQNNGGGDAHENRPPYIGVLFVIKL